MLQHQNSPMDSSDAISDPTDFASTPLAPLGGVDALLRCQICKDFFTNAVITSCCHTFCSLCIRRSLSAEGKCPTCRTTELENRLRRNVAIQELVDAYTKTRPDLLKFARATTTTSSQDHTDVAKLRSSKRKREIADDAPTPARPAPPPRTRSRSKLSTATAPASQPAQPMSLGSPAKSITLSPESLQEDSAAHGATSESQNGVVSGLVPCPICRVPMKEEAVFHHLDSCTGQAAPSKAPKESKPDPSAGAPDPSLTQERLPQLNYSLFKENALRKKLAELGISSWGSKALLVRRHTEWINLWNANCDSSRPKSRKQLLAELENWERSQGGRAKSSDTNIFGGAGSSETNSSSAIMRKEFDGAAWAKQNKPDFDALIANARGGASKKAANPATAAGETSTSRTTSRQSSGNQPTDPGDHDQAFAAPSTEPSATGHRRSIDTGRRRSSPVPGFSPRLPSEGSRDSIKSTAIPSPMTPPVATKRSVRRGSLAASPVASLSTESSLPDLIFRRGSMSEASELPTTELTALNNNGIKKKPMFELPSEPVADADTGSNAK